MATVQRYTPVSQMQQLPGVKAVGGGDQSAYGAGVAQQLGNLGGTMQAIGQFKNEQEVQQQHEDNLSAVQTALASSTKEISDLHYNADTGLLHMSGINAKGTTETSKKLSDEVIAKYSKMFTNDVQKNSFMKAIDPQLQSFQNTTMNHESQQTKVAAIQSSDSLSATNLDIASTAYNNIEIADNAFRLGIKSQATKGIILGLPNETINENIRKYSDGVVASMVKTALDQNDINGATTVVNRYSDKLDQSAINTLNSAISKKSVPIKSAQITESLFNQYGLDEKKGMTELKKQFGKDPNFKSYSADYQARLVDEKRYKNEAIKQNEESVLSNVWKSDNLESARSYINEAVNSGMIKPSQGLYLINQAKSKFKVLSEKATPEQTYWHNYERTGLISDIENIKLYEKRSMDGEPTPEQQKSANISAARLNSYWKFSSGGGYNPDAKQKETIPIDEYNLLKEKGFTDEQIQSEYLTEGGD